ncbi:MAG: hypothetical protein AB7T63_10620 [Planctomycetota bacterium]
MRVTLLLLSVLTLPLVACAGPDDAPRWEYRYVPNAGSIEVEFNTLGKEGWELSALDQRGGAVFKRPVK